ncbi:hypothetical protein SAMN04488109_1112 [Chryseolinea serpens]|uniref:Uncharacterized protein n=1 Tax=Chryseolinea serpens TaxID=947013 RepID=A0A1M5LAI4_9BACT|nr:hypothetical protein [Chryseolinea serpens]SHG62112.1 hypothetical protein SAMN04488109_1112 [Chryseolinea serpens]
MKQSNHIRLLASILVGFFMISSIVSDSLAALHYFYEVEGFALAEKLAPACKWIDLTFEEKEKEEENVFTPEIQSNLFFIGLVDNTGLFTIAESSSHSFYDAVSVCGHATTMPLYLATGSLLI